MDQNKSRIPGEIVEITDHYVRARVSINGVLLPTEFPRDIMDQTDIELKVGKYFIWSPSSRDVLRSEEFEPFDNPYGQEDTPSKEELLKAVDNFLKRNRENPLKET